MRQDLTAGMGRGRGDGGGWWGGQGAGGLKGETSMKDTVCLSRQVYSLNVVLRTQVDWAKSPATSLPSLKKKKKIRLSDTPMNNLAMEKT